MHSKGLAGAFFVRAHSKGLAGANGGIPRIRRVLESRAIRLHCAKPLAGPATASRDTLAAASTLRFMLPQRSYERFLILRVFSRFASLVYPEKWPQIGSGTAGEEHSKRVSLWNNIPKDELLEGRR